ncbi:T9SS type A sorting domain-containing protein [Hymenobacter canadensis]|uniref:T9SS type A sorting domain-containing protein n=1 Tax=Hymenobacter canadensis TaxID=2999067 RepID=A0ABY7LPZ3_9BACT|nr:T9SS type A sorting domain-containing protein [Hymenobacter canadensis]WBA40785.1 T9SS type A sorting domain-containing protein [Hymenobacter canadensis]
MMQLVRYFLLFVLLAGSSVQSQAVGRPTARPSRPAEERSLLIYPNPSTGIVHIAINGFEGRKLELRVLNVIGSVIYRETITELNDRFTKTLDLSKFANGLYYVKLEGDNASEMRKLVIR